MKSLATSRLIVGSLSLFFLSVEGLTRKRANGRDSFQHFEGGVKEHPQQTDRGKQ